MEYLSQGSFKPINNCQPVILEIWDNLQKFKLNQHFFKIYETTLISNNFKILAGVESVEIPTGKEMVQS